MESELIAQFPAPPACYPMELRYIKTLFVRQQYRHCASACRDVLSKLRSQFTQQPFHDTFALFYLGICHDELARRMHHHSTNKHQSFNTAKSFYLKALESLPSPDEAQAMYMIRAMTNMSAQRERSGSPTDSEPSVETAVREDSSSTLGKPSAASLTLSPFVRNDSPMDRTTGVTTTRAADSDDDSDLESHHSFDQIRTPSRNLQRDYSKMSLLDKTPPRQNNGPPPKLLHTVLDSPSKLFSSPESPSSPRQRNSDLPRLDTGSRAGAGSSMSGRWSQLSTPEPEEPVSPLGPEDWASEASTVSPISPTTPAAEMVPEFPVAGAGESEEEDEDEEFHDAPDSSQAALHFQASVEAMRDQIRKHISLVQHAKAQLLLLQASKKPEFSPKTRTKQARPRSGADAEEEEDVVDSVAGVYQARLYWSSVSEDVKLAEKRRRIEEGRKRNWARKRFEPERYIDLCEQTLAEL